MSNSFNIKTTATIKIMGVFLPVMFFGHVAIPLSRAL